ncbi:nuclear transport factor 2 family protein [Winogradskyella psychrotolerans]|uniref:SnoaL-like domain-containing protein n=1 Tax=Winogradskyella damuponensis TaxID=943939 RepID=A0ABP8CSL0_9FLAO|nr:nuclear transport factor 2 family protein [Winogradskyella psychrotolerans]MBU2920669.1 nuclear transport factor 2 family protein [Winogradskyella psychrotolerans]
MNTWGVAKKWKEMCEKGKNLECINELYAENVVSKEMPGMPGEVVTGKQNVWNKSKEWIDSVENIHASSISNPLVAGNFFTAKMDFDCTFKEGGRQKMEEVCVYEVKDGKITSEQYFYTM